MSDRLPHPLDEILVHDTSAADCNNNSSIIGGGNKCNNIESKKWLFSTYVRSWYARPLLPPNLKTIPTKSNPQQDFRYFRILSEVRNPFELVNSPTTSDTSPVQIPISTIEQTTNNEPNINQQTNQLLTSDINNDVQPGVNEINEPNPTNGNNDSLNLSRLFVLAGPISLLEKETYLVAKRDVAFSIAVDVVLAFINLLMELMTKKVFYESSNTIIQMVFNSQYFSIFVMITALMPILILPNMEMLFIWQHLR